MKNKFYEGNKSVRPFILLLLLAICALGFQSRAEASMEEVIILNVETISVEQCNPVAHSNHSVVNAGTVIGSVAGGLLGSRLTKNKTAGAVLGAGAGAAIGNQLHKSAQSPERICRKEPRYNVAYRRQNGGTGIVQLASMPTGKTTVLNFCSEAICN